MWPCAPKGQRHRAQGICMGVGGRWGALVGRVGAHRRWPVSICLLSKPVTPNLPGSCSARGALTGPVVGLRWRHVAGPIANPPGGLPSKFQGHPSTVARSHQARVGGSKNMAISIAPEPTHERSVIIYTGGKALAPTHPRPIPRVVAEQRARAAITRHTPSPAARPSPRRSWSSSRWPCAVPACRLFALPMYLGRRIRQPRHIGDGAPPGAPVRSLRVLPLHSPRGPSPTVAAHGPWNRQLVRNSAHLRPIWAGWV